MTSIITWNVNGIRAVHKKGLFVPFIEEYNPDILALQETKAERGQAEIDLPAYKEYWNSSTRKKGYSGTVIFTKDEPEATNIGFPMDIVEKYGLDKDSYGDPNAEGRVITAEYKDFFLVNSYTPNSKPDLSRLSLRHKQWDPAFLEYVKRLDEKKPVIFTGDLNAAHTEDDLANPKANEGEHGFTKEEREGIDKIIAAGFVDAFREFTKGNGHYTWWSHFAYARERNVGWRIDYFFVSKRLMKRVKSVEILDHILGSDHCPVRIVLD
ncbi:MAG: Exodeoxyribonuclease Xth [Parcubacteria group bacterium]|nr:Exodeoxyribonuclease Xth [Parcubacteria group bacterium]